MPIKKKKTEHVPAPSVKQVVEVVSEEAVFSSPDSSTAIAEALSQASGSEPPTPEELPEEAGAALEDHLVQEEKEKEKETVAELFKRPESPMPDISMHTRKGSKKRLLVLIVFAVLIAGAIGGGFVLAKGGNLLSIVAPTPTPTPTPSPTPTPKTLNRADLSIQVQNGGGVPGAASKMKKLLEDKGYKVADVSNADDYTFEKTEIHLKSDKSDYATMLTSDLQDTYSLATDTGTLSSDSPYDARVIVGKK